jgi:hypothetical protein
VLAPEPFYFAHTTDSFVGTPPTTIVGTLFTAGANNADGAAVGVLPALGHDVHYLILGIGGVNSSTDDSDALLDVLVDPAGGTAWAEFISDLICGYSPTPNSAIQLECWYHFPIFVRAGSSIGVRARCAHTAAITTGRVAMFAHGDPSRPDRWWCGQAVETLGVNPASSGGTNVTPGGSNAFGAWTNIGDATGARYGAIQMGFNGPGATTNADNMHLEIGYGSTKLPGSQTWHAAYQTTESCFRKMPQILTPCDIPAGTQMQARAKANAASPQVVDVAIYGVY